MDVDRSRNEEGKFIESSPYGKKVISVRLLKDDQDEFLVVSEELGISPTELARQIISEWLRNKAKRKTVTKKPTINDTE